MGDQLFEVFGPNYAQRNTLLLYNKLRIITSKAYESGNRMKIEKTKRIRKQCKPMKSHWQRFYPRNITETVNTFFFRVCKHVINIVSGSVERLECWTLLKCFIFSIINGCVVVRCLTAIITIKNCISMVVVHIFSDRLRPIIDVSARGANGFSFRLCNPC